MLIGLTQLHDKLLFVGLTPDYLLLRTRPQPGVAIPRVEGTCIDNCPTGRGNLAIFGGNRYLVPFNRGIATPVCALVRNDSVFHGNDSISLQAPICREAEESR